MNFDDFDATVLEFMNDFGFNATYLQSSEGTYDPSRGENVVTTTEIPIRAILLDRTLQSNGIGTQPGSLIQAGDKQLFIQPTQKVDIDATPLVVNPSSDRVRVGADTYKIVTYKEINTTAADQILIELYIRR